MSMTLSCQKEITIAFLNPTESGTYLSGPVKSFCPPKWVATLQSATCYNATKWAATYYNATCYNTTMWAAKQAGDEHGNILITIRSMRNSLGVILQVSKGDPGKLSNDHLGDICNRR